MTPRVSDALRGSTGESQKMPFQACRILSTRRTQNYCAETCCRASEGSYVALLRLNATNGLRLVLFFLALLAALFVAYGLASGAATYARFWQFNSRPFELVRWLAGVFHWEASRDPGCSCSSSRRV